MLVFKLIIGGAISYVLPSVVVERIKENHHLKIAWVGIISTSVFSISAQLSQDASGILSAACLLFVGFVAHSMANSMNDTEKIILYSCAVIGLFVGFGYIFQGISLYAINKWTDVNIYCVTTTCCTFSNQLVLSGPS